MPSQKRRRPTKKRPAPQKRHVMRARPDPDRLNPEADRILDTDKLVIDGKTLSDFKFEGVLVMAVRNDKGEIVGEIPGAQMVVYKPEFAKLEERIEAVLPEIKRQWAEGQK